MSVKRFLSLFAAVWAVSALAGELRTAEAVYCFNDVTGALQSISALASGKTPVKAARNTYLIQRKSGDITLDEKFDQVKSTAHKEGEFVYVCVNKDFPQFEITKRYWVVDGVLRREFTFKNNSAEKVYVFPFTESVFSPEFKRKSYYFGAGYLGPYKPAAVVDKPTEVNEYVQTSKGMVLINADENLGSYCHYRVKINDKIVYPWWQSAIGRYREKADRLYYMPNGWKMCLGALDVEPDGGSIRLTDAFAFFRGGLHDFFSSVYGKDSEIMNQLKTIEPVPEIMDDIIAHVSMASNDSMAYLGEMLDEGTFMYSTSLLGRWFEYGADPEYISWQGGRVTLEDLSGYFRSIRDMVPNRVMTSNYTIALAATETTPVLQTHPEWFRKYDRSGRLDSLFPGMSKNYQAMHNKPEVRQFFIDSVLTHARAMGHKMIYVDEAQQYNVINWQTGEVMRDDHSIDLWSELRTAAASEGLIFTMNGSGQPYGDFNYMENWHLLSPPKWREYAGVALGLELFGQYVPGSRIGPLYWHILRENDYTNRLMALGWLPCLQYAADEYPLAPVRAAFEVGNAEPIKVKFTPDWKSDPVTDVEAYAIQRRNSQDSLVSFINRGNKKDLKITIDLATLNYNKNTRVNIWRMPVWRFAQETPRKECKTGDYFYLANREYRELYRNFNWTGGFIGAPELVYSGNAEGVFKDTAPQIDRDHMVQYIITPGNMAVYSINDLACNYYFTKARKVVVDGNKIVNRNGKVEIMLVDCEWEFTDITVDGKSVPVKTADVKNKRVQIVEIPAGEHEIAYKKVPRQKVSAAAPRATYNAGKKQIEIAGSTPEQLYALELRGHTLYSGSAPIKVPAQHEGGEYIVRRVGSSAAGVVTLPDGFGTFVPRKTHRTKMHPEQKRVENVDKQVGKVRITRRATYISEWEDAYELQRYLAPSEVKADVENLTLRAGTTKRERVSYVKHYTKNFAGFEFDGAKQLRVKFRSTFGEATALNGSHITYNRKQPKVDFAGFVIDFSVNGKYSKRVALSTAIYDKRLEAVLPPWGCARKLDAHFDLGPIAEEAAEQTLSFDLTEIAPENWDGKVYFSVGGSNLSANRLLEVEFIEFNNRKADDFVKFSTAKYGTPDPVAMPRLAAPPKSMKKLQTNEFAEWAKIEKLQQLQSTFQEITQQTRAYCAYDRKNLYIAVFAEETDRDIIAFDQPLWKNDCVELYFITPENKLLQMVIDARGKVTFGEFLKDRISTRNIVIRGQAVKGKGFWSFAAIPWSTLKITNITAGTQIKFNLCRTRVGERTENGTWGACQSRYAETDGFGILQLGRFGQGQGRWEEINLDNRD